MKSMRAVFCFVLILTLLLAAARAAELKIGDESLDVETLELRLKALGYSVDSADTVYDAATRSAVAAFRQDHGLGKTGEVNARTWKELFNEYVTLTWGEYSARIKLAAPFSAISSTKEIIGGMYYKDVDCVIFLDAASSLAQYAKADIDDAFSYFEEDLLRSHPDGHFNQVWEMITVGSRAASTAHVVMDWTEDGATHYIHKNMGWLEMDQVSGKSVIFSVLITQQLEGADEPPITEDTVLDILSHVLGEGEEPKEDDDIIPVAEKVPQEKEQQSEVGTDIRVGDFVSFGHYEQDNNFRNGSEEIEWIVLDIDGDKALLISKYALDSLQYNDLDQTLNVTWEDCGVRKWLNGYFLNSAFTSEERKRLAVMTVPADKNPSYPDSDPGNETQDKVFLLSIQETERYFSADSSRICYATEYAKAKGVKSYSNGACWWWLRSPGRDTSNAASVDSYGRVSYYGDGILKGSNAIRPVVALLLP